MDIVVSVVLGVLLLGLVARFYSSLFEIGGRLALLGGILTLAVVYVAALAAPSETAKLLGYLNANTQQAFAAVFVTLTACVAGAALVGFVPPAIRELRHPSLRRPSVWENR